VDDVAAAVNGLPVDRGGDVVGGVASLDEGVEKCLGISQDGFGLLFRGCNCFVVWGILQHMAVKLKSRRSSG